MSLQRQLLLVSLLLLSLPLAGVKFISEIQNVLRQSQEQAALATTQAIASAIAETANQFYYPDNYNYRDSIYAPPSKVATVLDGYDDDWETPAHHRYQLEQDNNQSEQQLSTNFAVSYQARTDEQHLYLLLNITDSQVVYHNPQASPFTSGDHVVLQFNSEGKKQQHYIHASAPGITNSLQKIGKRAYASPIQGFWMDTSTGYRLELKIPRNILSDNLGFAVINQKSNTQSEQWLGNYSPVNTSSPPLLITTPPELLNALSIFASSNMQLSFVDAHHWQRATVGSSTYQPPKNTHAPNWVLQKLYRGIIEDDNVLAMPTEAILGQDNRREINAALSGNAAANWYKQQGYNSSTLLSAASAVVFNQQVIGAVVAQQSSDYLLAQTDQAFSELLYYSVLAMCFSVFGLLGYATLLSLRIRKLGQAVQTAINDDGSINTFASSNHQDEIGQLSRQYQQLLERLQEYINYLRTLSRKLSHELRTPIAVIQSSLENIEQDKDPTQQTIYTHRAQQGLQRLSNILSAISEATRLDESIKQQQPERFDLTALLTEMTAAYQSVYTEHSISLNTPSTAIHITGVPDLMVQMLDKLIDNATDFCPKGGKITISLEPKNNELLLSIANEGELLPTHMQSQLFDSMVSIRPQQSDDLHLGLGLHIVKLIVDYHQGSIKARNLDDGTGVEFCISLPTSN